MRQNVLWMVSLAGCSAGCANGYEVYVVEYAHSTGVPAERLIAGATGETLDMSWNFLVGIGNERVVLLDAGMTYFETENPSINYFKNYWMVDEHRTIEDTLATVGVTPADVTEVWITHKHADHLEGIRDLPNAHVYIRGAEWDEAVAEAAADPFADLAYPALLPVLQQVEAEGRLHRLDETTAQIDMGPGYPYWPMLDGGIAEGGKHTNHSTMMGIRCTNDGNYYLAGDAAYTYRNMEQQVAVAQTVDPVGNVEDVRNLVEYAGGIDRVLPGHDPAVFDRFPAVSDGAAQICD